MVNVEALTHFRGPLRPILLKSNEREDARIFLENYIGTISARKSTECVGISSRFYLGRIHVLKQAQCCHEL